MKHHDDGSVTTWIGRTRSGDSRASEKLLGRYFQSLVDYARGRVPTHLCQMADGEDVAIMAFSALLDGLKEGRLDHVKNRNDLWRMLTLIAARKAQNHVKHELRQKRGGPRQTPGSGSRSQIASQGNATARGENDPAWIAEFMESCRIAFGALPSDEFRQIAQMRLAGHSVEEIASHFGRASRTIERKLGLIRAVWKRFE